MVAKAKEAWEKAKNPVLILGAGVLQDTVAAERARLLAERKGAKVLAMTPAANARGLGPWGPPRGEGGLLGRARGPLRLLRLRAPGRGP